MSITSKKAALISAKELPSIIDTAIKAAGDRVGSNSHLIVRWDLAGKIVKTWAEAEHLSESVARHVSAAGFEATPAVLAIDKKIIAGFFERIAVPQIRNL